MMTTGGTIVPKYNYGCEVCERHWSQWNSMGSDAVECPHCFSKNIKKLPANFTVVKTEHDNQKTSKENVIDHIEENRKILRNMRQKAAREDVLNND